MKLWHQVQDLNGDLEAVLKNRGVNLERGKRVIDRLIKERSGRIVKNNPEKKYHKEKPSLDSMEHYSQSEFSLQSQSYKSRSPARALPRNSKNYFSHKQNQQKVLVTEDSILAERARQFVNRLRKQKQYEQGKALLRRKKEEELHQKRNKQKSSQKQKEKVFVRLERYRKMMDNILYHEERASFRLRSSINRYKTPSIRCKTEGSEDLQKKQISRSAMFDYEKSKKESRVSELPTLVSMKQRLATLSHMMDSLEQ